MKDIHSIYTRHDAQNKSIASFAVVAGDIWEGSTCPSSPGTERGIIEGMPPIPVLLVAAPILAKWLRSWDTRIRLFVQCD